MLRLVRFLASKEALCNEQSVLGNGASAEPELAAAYASSVRKPGPTAGAVHRIEQGDPAVRPIDLAGWTRRIHSPPVPYRPSTDPYVTPIPVA